MSQQKYLGLVANLDDGFALALIAAGEQGRWMDVCQMLEVLIEHDSIHRFTGVGPVHALMAAQQDSDNPHITLDMYNGPNTQADNGSSPVAVAMRVFDGGGYMGGNGALTTAQHEALLALLVGYKPPSQDHCNEILAGAVMHVHDPVFWTKLFDALPQLALQDTKIPYKTYRSSRVSQAKSNLIDMAFELGNSSLCGLMMEKGVQPNLQWHHIITDQNSVCYGAMQIASNWIAAYERTPGFINGLMSYLKNASKESAIFAIWNHPRIKELPRDYLEPLADKNGWMLLKDKGLFAERSEKGIVVNLIKEIGLHSGNLSLVKQADACLSFSKIQKPITVMDVFNGQLHRSADEFKQFVADLMEAGLLELNVPVHGKGKTAAHELGMNGFVISHGSMQNVIDVAVARFNALVELGLDMDAKDDRGWSGWSYLDSDLRSRFKTLERASSARDMAQQAAGDIRASLGF